MPFATTPYQGISTTIYAHSPNKQIPTQEVLIQRINQKRLNATSISISEFTARFPQVAGLNFHVFTLLVAESSSA